MKFVSLVVVRIMEKKMSNEYKFKAALQFIAEQHCPDKPESALGRTLKMCIEHAKEILDSEERAECICDPQQGHGDPRCDWSPFK